MNVLDRYGLTKIINARGTFTPLGVSRSSDQVSRAVAEALQDYFVIDELQDLVSRKLAGIAGSEAGAVTHCVAAGITMSIAAAMVGTSPEKIAALPDTKGIPNRVVLPANHAIDYGHPIQQAVRLAGATPVLAGTVDECSLADIDGQLRHADTCCLLLVSSRLTTGRSVDLSAAVDASHLRGVPTIIDGAAQDMRIKELLATNADLVLVSAHKYMASPTAGLVIGRKALVDAVRAQERGIGRAMKATKEAIIGVLSALEERSVLHIAEWRETQACKVSDFVGRANELPGVKARSVPDPAGMPFMRAHVQVDDRQTGVNARSLAVALKNGVPSIWVMDDKIADGDIVFELVQTDRDEIDTILAQLSKLLSRSSSPDGS
ncbi:MAG: aminotransferase class V-fold PLP-dependent enzyme [Geminicoccaceae bacterium]